MSEKQIRDVVIVAYGRSAIGRAGKGSLKTEHAVDYGAKVLQGVLKKIPSLDLQSVDDVIVGCAKPEGVQGSILGRVIAQRAGLPDEVAGQTINRFCSSGLQAIATGAYSIMSGQATVVIAGGVESMTAIPMGSDPKVRNKWVEENKPGVYMSMGMTAEKVADKYGISRQEMENMAVDSHFKAAQAQEKGLFVKEIIPIVVQNEQGQEIVFEKDEGVRKNTTLATLSTLAPCFKEDGKVTAATASQVSDGAAFVVMMSAAKASELGLKPIAKFLSFAVTGVAADIMGIGPIKAVPKAMALANISNKDLDVIEINEAFAAQAVPCIKELGLDISKVNPRGGAIALGHPLGATGAILTCKALSYLEDSKGKYALVTMCVGTGMGAAAVFEML